MSKFPYIVILDNIRSALNVGAIFRTCDAAGAEKLYLAGITPYPPHNRIPKTALGAIELVAWERADSTTELVKQLKQDGYAIISVEQTETSQPFQEVNYPEKTALVFGHEISGVDPEVIALSNQCIEIPMFGEKKSLNVATTVGIICYQVSLRFHAK